MEVKASNYLSRLKIIATFLVVLVHSRNLLGYASYTGNAPIIKFFNTFSAAGILIFFAVSGYLLFRRDFDWAENMKKKCRSLLIPFLFWNTFWLLFELVGMYILPAYFEKRFEDGFLGWFIGFFGIPFYIAPMYTPLWFIRDLFLLNAVAPVIKWVIDRFPVRVTLGILIVIWFLPWPYKLWYNLCQSVVFFTLGGLIARRKISFPLNRTTKLAAILCCLLIAVAACIPSIGMWSPLLRVLVLLAFTAISIGAAAFEMPRVTGFMQYSFPIYVLHGKPLSVLQILYTKLVPQSVWTVVGGYFLLPIVIVALCIVAAAVLKRCVPRLYAIVTGAR